MQARCTVHSSRRYNIFTFYIEQEQNNIVFVVTVITQFVLAVFLILSSDKHVHACALITLCVKHFGCVKCCGRHSRCPEDSPALPHKSPSFFYCSQGEKKRKWGRLLPCQPCVYSSAWPPAYGAWTRTTQTSAATGRGERCPPCLPFSTRNF